ncbi:Phenylalanine--tRNA ligase beta subunit [Candidatus Erwinia haradaeae]|uniref:Phenylalanine--tRNA ligase beta subunit n=1 Tax=Candidatus Erwinia haradaeae TaxID=1922217 RepID=A0A451DCB3_9GAMM|nr:phenylalanine--tRNA ligase subunit beta [Candidatus Erwinia haradaeae]VFP84020.1 Phenylalanine--tRNA ligase beta subunit [Candidatus Erwinia haradaeae]
MKVSERWLREWVNPNMESLVLCNTITMAGLEVNHRELVSPAFHGVVVGEVVQCVKHPRTDKLYATKINIGIDRFLHIICGASNCREGIKVAVATVGATLPNNMSIQASLIQGELSEGMLCSFSELGIKINQEGIIELPRDAIIGIHLYEYLQLDDNIIEMSVSSNRADCLSIMGIARDISVITSTPLCPIEIPLIKVSVFDTLLIHIDAPEVCPRYLGRVVKGVNIHTPTPLWMKEKLRRCGIYSYNILQDIVHYVLLELGQPIDVFDLRCIEGTVTIRYSQEGEVFSLIDNSTVTFDNKTLVIADDKKILSIAGVCGSKGSSITVNTQNIFLGAGFFQPLSIAGCSHRYHLYTDASHRFERGVDPEFLYQAIERTTGLLLAICGGYAGALIDCTNRDNLPLPHVILLSRKNIDRLIGCILSEDIIIDILQRLGCKIINQLLQGQWEVVIPTWRFDLSIEVDLIEEIMRVYGYHKIPNTLAPVSVVMNQNSEKKFSLQRAKELLVDKGYQEAITYSFVNPKVQTLLHPASESLKLLRPISAEMSVMRLSLWSGLLGAVIYNQNRQQSHIRFFESGLCFIPDITAPLGVRQELLLAGAMSGNRYHEHWDQTQCDVDFYDLKGDLESLLDLMNQLQNVDFIGISHPALHPGQCAGLYIKKEYIGCIGVIHPDIEGQLGYKSRIIVFELLWEKVADCMLSYAVPVSRFPVNYRDISMIIAESIPAGAVISECKNIGEKYNVVGVNIVDVYRGEKITEGFKSVTISIAIQAANRTLEEKEIATTIDKCISSLKNKFNILLRE